MRRIASAAGELITHPAGEAAGGRLRRSMSIGESPGTKPRKGGEEVTSGEETVGEAWKPGEKAGRTGSDDGESIVT